MRINIGEVRVLVQHRYKITREEILGQNRARKIARPRQIAMALAREFCGASYPLIGQHFGGRDHTTVLNAVNRVQERYATSPIVREAVDELREQLWMIAEAPPVIRQLTDADLIQPMGRAA